MANGTRWVEEPCTHLARALEAMRKNGVRISWSEWASLGCNRCNVAMNEDAIQRAQERFDRIEAGRNQDS